MKIRLALLILVALLTAGSSVAFAQGGATRPNTQPAPAPKLVTLNLNNVPLRDAVKQLLDASDLSIIILGELPAEPRVTLRLKEAEPLIALQMIAQLGRLDFSPYSNVPQGMPMAIIAPQSSVLFPSSNRGPGSGSWERGGVPMTNGGGVGPGAGPAPLPSLPDGFASSMVDLDVKDRPFREVMAMLDRQSAATAHARIVVDESVPQSLKVTARLYKMPLAWVFANLVQQAGLTYGVRGVKGIGIQEDSARAEAFLEQALGRKLTEEDKQVANNGAMLTLFDVYVVPIPELQVTGGSGGGGSGGGGMGPGPRGMVGSGGGMPGPGMGPRPGGGPGGGSGGGSSN